MTSQIIRCPWCGTDPDYVKYHDEEWGKEVTDERVLFEFLILESAQAGLSWLTILRRRAGYRAAFADFDYHQVATYTPKKIDELVLNPAIIRHRGKIEAAVATANVFWLYNTNSAASTRTCIALCPLGVRSSTR